MPETNARIKVCHDTAANFKTNNPTLLVGEWALETDTKKMKIGDGSTAYNALPYSTAEDSDEWRKPDDWIDIRSGALPNSVYFLVGHSADYTLYPTFTLYAEVSNSGTYDVYVDGIKQATQASGTTTTLNWQTLALSSGFDVTYPSALRTHVVRVSATSSSNDLNAVMANDHSYSDTTANGVLWAHFTTTKAINLTYAFNNTTPLLEVVTASDHKIITHSFTAVFFNCPHLQEIPAIDLDGWGANIQVSFRYCESIKKIKFSNMKMTSANNADYTFHGCTHLTEIELDNSVLAVTKGTFMQCTALKSLPVPLILGDNLESTFYQVSSVRDTFLDASQQSGLKSVNLNSCAGLKGITVSSSAPFNGMSPQINVSNTGLNRAALVNLFKSMPYNVGYTVVGTPTIVDGVASGFSASNYLQAQQLPADFWTNDFEICVALKTPTSWPSGDAYLLKGSRKRVGDTGNDNGIVTWWSNNKLSISGSYKNISGSTPFTVEIVPELNTMYFMKMVQVGHTISGYYSLDGSSWTLLNTADDYGYAGTPNTLATLFGQDDDCSGFSIDLNNTYIKRNGVLWFAGKEAMTKTCDVRGCTGTADLTAEDKAIATGKGWELTVA